MDGRVVNRLKREPPSIRTVDAGRYIFLFMKNVSEVHGSADKFFGRRVIFSGARTFRVEYFLEFYPATVERITSIRTDVFGPGWR